MKVGKQGPNQVSISVAYYRKDKAERRRTKALRLKTKHFGGGRTEGIES